MAQMIPQRTEAQLNALESRGEAQFYRACRDKLDQRLLVFHSVCFLRQRPTAAPIDGEADFVIFDPQGGFLVVEVKGGGITRDRQTDQWFTQKSSGTKKKLPHSPIDQAKREKHAIREELRNHPRWKNSTDRILEGHTVFFPNVDDVSPLLAPDIRPEIVGGRADLDDLPGWFMRACRFWAGNDRRFRRLEEAGLEAVKEIFGKKATARALMSSQLKEEEERRIILTDEQSRLLRSLGSRKEAKISGGAGTGKTVLAIEKARRLAADGKQTLLLSVNRALVDHFKATAGDTPNLLPMNFHQLCEWAMRLAKHETGRDVLQEAQASFPGADKFDVHFPMALALASEVVKAPFDACIVDEGQDFHPDFWLPLKRLLKPEPVFMVFYDQNQAVYKRLDRCPIQEEPFVLTKNCRNTRFIHEAAYRYFHGDATDACDIEGAPIEQLNAPRLQDQANLIYEKVTQLLKDERVPPEQIAVLVADSKSKQAYYDLLKNKRLPNAVAWAEEVHRSKGTVLMDTAMRYKGLEAAVTILWGLDQLDLKKDRELIYVAFSRAKSRLYLAGPTEACRALLAPEALR
ncbi:DUF2075 domain-containing protein [Corallococcus praedator]|uniref:DNA 3'-5' helicase II n=1 Tax=Corallococcus praedator TaxID=2316724 RepID=A0ABX9QRH2_9BACT|nr:MULTISPECIES: nuclease-related domain-containing DEAD/DEAH box helicase [Corallococcus]RKH34942.1 DUF2075 domain-containing protein [Corallococcus sp. CA031C]RKI17142.1 DUF2075 domain-containing protein [Corallococcus praedator]